MPTALLTFSGKFGDVMWSLPAARELSRHGWTVDFATMDQFKAVHDLLRRQPYLRSVFSIPKWVMEHDGCGAWPRVPPSVPDGYDRVVHLTYERRPTKPLILHAFEQLGLAVPQNPVPFLHGFEQVPEMPPFVAYAFNEAWLAPKTHVLNALFSALPNVSFVPVAVKPFVQAAETIKAARFFLGCRSANYVLATGLGQRCLSVEPEPGRREEIFSCPWGREMMPAVDDVDAFVRIAQAWMSNKET